MSYTPGSSEVYCGAAARVIRAKTVSVITPERVLVDLNLGFGSHQVRHVYLEGFDSRLLTAKTFDAAMKAAVVLVGGKRLLVLARETDDAERPLRGKVYLDEKVSDATMAAVEQVEEVAGTRRLNVGLFLSRLDAVGYDMTFVKKVLNG